MKVAYRRIKGKCYSIYVEGKQHVTKETKHWCHHQQSQLSASNMRMPY